MGLLYVLGVEEEVKSFFFYLSSRSQWGNSSLAKEWLSLCLNEFYTSKNVEVGRNCFEDLNIAEIPTQG